MSNTMETVLVLTATDDTGHIHTRERYPIAHAPQCQRHAQLLHNLGLTVTVEHVETIERRMPLDWRYIAIRWLPAEGATS